jgi:hypothetical protein
MLLAQTILDCFPDSVSQYGLIGCGLTVAIAIDLLVIAYAFGRRSGMRTMLRSH